MLVKLWSQLSQEPWSWILLLHSMHKWCTKCRGKQRHHHPLIHTVKTSRSPERSRDLSENSTIERRIVHAMSQCPQLWDTRLRVCVKINKDGWMVIGKCDFCILLVKTKVGGLRLNGGICTSCREGTSCTLVIKAVGEGHQAGKSFSVWSLRNTCTTCTFVLFNLSCASPHSV